MAKGVHEIVMQYALIIVASIKWYKNHYKSGKNDILRSLNVEQSNEESNQEYDCQLQHLINDKILIYKKATDQTEEATKQIMNKYVCM